MQAEQASTAESEKARTPTGRGRPAESSMEPRDLVEELERSPELPEGEEERFSGYGVMAAPFRSGDILAMRRFPASSLGGGYTSVWYKAPDGSWTFWSDRDPLQACPRFFGSAITRAEVAPIDVRWEGARAFVVEIADAGLRWEVELGSAPATRMLNSLGSRLSDRLWRNKAMLSAMQWFAGELLQAGRLGLSGIAPNGQQFIANPMRLWTIPRSRATLGQRQFHDLGPVPEQAHLGDFWIPQRGLFAIGRAFFEPANPAKHRIVAQLTAP